MDLDLSTITQKERDALNEIFLSLSNNRTRFNFSQIGSELQKFFLYVFHFKKRICFYKSSLINQKSDK